MQGEQTPAGWVALGRPVRRPGHAEPYLGGPSFVAGLSPQNPWSRSFSKQAHEEGLSQPRWQGRGPKWGQNQPDIVILRGPSEPVSRGRPEASSLHLPPARAGRAAERAGPALGPSFPDEAVSPQCVHTRHPAPEPAAAEGGCQGHRCAPQGAREVPPGAGFFQTGLLGTPHTPLILEGREPAGAGALWKPWGAAYPSSELRACSGSSWWGSPGAAVASLSGAPKPSSTLSPQRSPSQ